MSETPETRPTTVATEPAAVPVKPYWLYRFAAWVVIVAGIVFVITTVFFAGFKIAGHHGHHGCHHHWKEHAMAHHGAPHGQGADFHGGPGGPGGSASLGPSQPPTSVAPSLAPAHP